MLLSVVILAIFLCISSAEISSFVKTYQFPEHKVYPMPPYGDMTKLNYARFNRSQSNLLNRRVITMIDNALENSTDKIKQCEVSFKAEMSDGTIVDNFWVYEFGSDKAILVWIEAQNIANLKNFSRSVTIKITIVDMTRDCKTVETTVRKYQIQDTNQLYLNCFQLNVIAFEDTFEVLLLDKVNKCDDRPMCNLVLYKFDSKGHKLSGPESWPKELLEGPCPSMYFVRPVRPSWPTEGYFIVELDRISLAKDVIGGESNDINKLQMWRKEFNVTIEGYRYSLENNIVGLCVTIEYSHFICWQFDKNGQILRETEIKLEHELYLLLDRIQNLRNGGLLLSLYIRQGEQYLIEIDQQGVMRAVELNFEVVCPGESLSVSRIFENKKGQYCKAKMITEIQTIPKTVGITANNYVLCYSPDEFSKCVKQFCL